MLGLLATFRVFRHVFVLTVPNTQANAHSHSAETLLLALSTTFRFIYPLPEGRSFSFLVSNHHGCHSESLTDTLLMHIRKRTLLSFKCYRLFLATILTSPFLSRSFITPETHAFRSHFLAVKQSVNCQPDLVVRLNASSIFVCVFSQGFSSRQMCMSGSYLTSARFLLGFLPVLFPRFSQSLPGTSFLGLSVLFGLIRESVGSSFFCPSVFSCIDTVSCARTAN